MLNITEIDMELIDDPKVDIRGDIDREGIEELATSIENIGLIQPIVVFKKRSRYEVIVGHRRTLACKIAGLRKIPAIVREVEPEEIDIMKLDENVFREEVSPVQIARYMARIMKDNSMNTMEIARYFGKTPQWANSMLRLLDTDEYTQEAIDKGEISYVSALELQKIEDDDRRRMYTEAAVKGGAHTRTVRTWVQEENAAARERVRRAQQGEGEEERREPKEYKMKCMLCGKLHEVNSMITVQVGIKCYPQLRILCKQYQQVETD